MHPPTTNTCQKCGSTIPLLWDDAPNMDAGLTVRLTGGYGEFVDAIDGPHEFILCHDCGHGLADFLGIDVRGWHSHPEIGWHGLEV